MIVVTHEPDIAAYANRNIHFKDGKLQLDERIAHPREAAAGTGGGSGMKKILASMKIALRALRVNRMRSALTMLGIIIGVAAVIAMVAVGSGATAADPGTDPEYRQQPDHRAAGQHQHERRAAGIGRDGFADRRRRQSDRGGMPVGGGGGAHGARRRAGGLRQQ